MGCENDAIKRVIEREKENLTVHGGVTVLMLIA